MYRHVRPDNNILQTYFKAYNCTYEPRSEKRLAFSQYYQTEDTHYGSCVVSLTVIVRQKASNSLNAT